MAADSVNLSDKDHAFDSEIANGPRANRDVSKLSENSPKVLKENGIESKTKIVHASHDE